MSRVSKFIWPVPDSDAICAPQQRTSGAGSLILNGNLSTPKSGTDIRVVDLGYISRLLNISSAGNLSGVQFTISGYSDGTLVEETLAGPNAGVVNTTKYFSRIDSVTVNAAVASNVSVGTGLTGSTFWYLSDYYRTIADLTIIVNITGTINYTFQTTLDDPEKIATPYVITPIDGVTIPTIPAASTMTAATADCATNYTFPTHSSRIVINSSGVDGQLTAYFMQQG